MLDAGSLGRPYGVAVLSQAPVRCVQSACADEQHAVRSGERRLQRRGIVEVCVADVDAPFP